VDIVRDSPSCELCIQDGCPPRRDGDLRGRLVIHEHGAAAARALRDGRKGLQAVECREGLSGCAEDGAVGCKVLLECEPALLALCLQRAQESSSTQFSRCVSERHCTQAASRLQVCGSSACTLPAELPRI
jgi:hypothetical protein